MTWDGGEQWGADRDRALRDRSAAQLVAPVLAGAVGAVVIHLALFMVVLAVAVSVTDSARDFGTGQALLWGTIGAIDLAVAAAGGARVCGWLAGIRGVDGERARRVALFTALGFAAVVLVFGVAIALRPVTLPVYVVLAVVGALAGSGRRPGGSGRVSGRRGGARRRAPSRRAAG